jgi:hypothetical protein
VIRLFEGDLQVVAQVGPALRPRGAPAPARVHAAEEHVEQVAEAALEIAKTWPAAVRAVQPSWP